MDFLQGFCGSAFLHSIFLETMAKTEKFLAQTTVNDILEIQKH